MEGASYIGYRQDMYAVTDAELAAHFDLLIDKVVTARAALSITRGDGEAVVLVAQREWDAIQKMVGTRRLPPDHSNADDHSHSG